MANSATLRDTIPAQFGRLRPVYEYEVSIDTTGQDLAVRVASATDKRVWVIGLIQSENNSGNLILKSESKTKTLELAANQAIYDKTSQGFIFCTKPGETLTIQASMAISGLTLYVVEGEAFYGFN